MNKSIRLFVSSLLIAALSAIATSKAPQARAADKQLTTALSVFNQRKYGEAAKLFSVIEKSKGTDASVQYYLGASALLSGNHALGRNALCRAAVMTSQRNPFHVQALALLEKYFRCKPYSCLRSFSSNSSTTFRFAKSAMPIKIYNSDGRMLPAAYHRTSIDRTDVRQVAALISSGATARLPVVPDFRSEYRSAMSKGINQWGWAVGEQLISYQFVSDPRTADIVIFWAPTLHGNPGWTTSHSTPKQPTIIQMSMDELHHYRGNTSAFAASVENVASHEFGHALGLEHSPSNEDLMFPTPEATVVGPDGSVLVEGGYHMSENDRASLRGLYSGVTGLAMPSVAGK